jgi:rubredoxin
VAIRLCCPACGSDRLETIEQLYGHARGAATLHVDPDGRLTTDFEHYGDTDVDWNSSTTVGIRCSACAWSYLSADAPEDVKAGETLRFRI